MKPKNFFKLVVSVAVCEAAGAIGAQFSLEQIRTWYPTLHTPPLNPPTWVFGPVWVGLYVLIGIALYLIWQSNGPDRKRALWLFAVQLVLNALWAPLFFGAHLMLLALAVIVLLWLSIYLTIRAARTISTTAVRLLLPYFAWVSFATYLNFALWWLNK